nr:MAG TPA: DVL family [Caudoviricetes sp.]
MGAYVAYDYVTPTAQRGTIFIFSRCVFIKEIPCLD